MGVTLFIIIPSDPLANSVSYSCDLGSIRIQFSVPNRGMLPPEDTIMVPLSWKLRLLPSQFGLLTLMNQQPKQVVTVLGVVTDPDYQGEIGLLQHSRDCGRSLKVLLPLLHPVI